MRMLMLLLLVFIFASSCQSVRLDRRRGPQRATLLREGRKIEVAGGIDFSKAEVDPATGKKCILKEIEVDTLEKQPLLECTHKNVEQCHYTYVTKFTSSQEQICEENFEKKCQITFKQQAMNETVQKCYKPIEKVCNGEGPEECRTVYESSCATKYVEKQPGKFVGQSACEKVPVKVCGRGCVYKEGAEECHNKVVASLTEVPEEVCDLNPRKICRYSTKLVPRLLPEQQCTTVPKETCHLTFSKTKPKKKPLKTKWCLDENDSVPDDFIEETNSIDDPTQRNIPVEGDSDVEQSNQDNEEDEEDFALNAIDSDILGTDEEAEEDDPYAPKSFEDELDKAVPSTPVTTENPEEIVFPEVSIAPLPSLDVTTDSRILGTADERESDGEGSTTIEPKTISTTDATNEEEITTEIDAIDQTTTAIVPKKFYGAPKDENEGETTIRSVEATSKETTSQDTTETISTVIPTTESNLLGTASPEILPPEDTNKPNDNTIKAEQPNRFYESPSFEPEVVFTEEPEGLLPPGVMSPPGVEAPQSFYGVSEEAPSTNVLTEKEDDVTTQIPIEEPQVFYGAPKFGYRARL